MIKVFIGFDRNETIAYHVLANSIMRHSTEPVSITPLILKTLPLDRQRNEFQSTEFSFSRFLVPYLCDFKGKAIFMDCDMICRANIAELWNKDNYKAVSVVKHYYTPKMENKFLDQPQSNYKMKNWSSVMLFDNEQCKRLTPQIVNEESGMYLHQFHWLPDETLIGELPKEWNHLVNEENQCELKDAKIVHYTQGTPCFAKYNHGEAAMLWNEERRLMNYHNRAGEFSLVEKVAP